MERLGKNIEHDFEEAEHTKSAHAIFNSLPLIGRIYADNDSTSSQGEEKDTFEENGLQALYGLKLGSELNKKINLNYDAPLVP